MAYAWAPNRDSGSVRRHRNPDTHRRYPRSEVGMMFKAHNGRASMNAAMRVAFPLLSTGLYDVSVAPVRRGWDKGDPLSVGLLVVEADPREDDFEYEPIPDWVWDQMYADTLGIEGPVW